jgi:hypothetical protein
MHAAGYVYGFTSPSMPGLVNIGATDRDPSERLAEANASPWCPPEPYVAAYTAAVGSALATVRGIHALLEARRVNPRLEFFRVSDDEARALFAVVARLAPAQVDVDADSEVRRVLAEHDTRRRAGTSCRGRIPTATKGPAGCGWVRGWRP